MCTSRLCLKTFVSALLFVSAFASSAVQADWRNTPATVAQIGGKTVVTVRTPDGLEQLILSDNGDGTFSGMARRAAIESAGGDSRVVGGGWVGSQLKLFFVSRRGHPVSVSVSGGKSLAGFSGKVLRAPSTLKRECSSHTEPMAASTSTGSGNGSSTSSITKVRDGSKPARIVEVATYADYELYQQYGANTNAYIRAIMAAVDATYRRQMNIGIRVTIQTVFDSPMQPTISNDSDYLLTEFQDFGLATGVGPTADVHHLVSGKTFQSSIAGLAYRGVACLDNGMNSFGITERVYDPLQWILSAHEIGHNLGAGHTRQGQGIMSPTVSTDLTRFAPQSIQEIGLYISAFGQCLSRETSQLSLKLSFPTKSQLAASWTIRPAKNCNVTLFADSNLHRVLANPETTVAILSSSTQSAFKIRYRASAAAKSKKAPALRSYYFQASGSCEDGTVIKSQVYKVKSQDRALVTQIASAAAAAHYRP